MNSFSYIALIPALPLLGFLLIGLLNSKITRNTAGLLATALIGIATILSYTCAYQYFFGVGKVNGVYESIIAFQFNWLNLSPQLAVNFGAILDPISVLMLVVVTTVSLMVFIYSYGYMHGEEGFNRYYSFLSLFTFSMLSLVLATNIVQMYIFWELVGISSFLLIGYYYDKPAAVAASKKAFIVTRFADLFFLIGILILSYYTGTLDIATMTDILTGNGDPVMQSSIAATFMGYSVISCALLMVFIGGAGKSAMFPLHIWLPDAMEGPTPVSALIHAATMVVAGVYLVARLFPMYAIAAPGVLEIIAYVGVFSALLAALIACTQFDIKRVLAYSTVSQIGFMIFALGVAGYGGGNELGYMASMFHLTTHAMFKALLFLCAGAVIHKVHTNDMREMGGLRKKLPITHLTFLIACLAISGIPPLSGFFSKEFILSAAFNQNSFVFYMGLITAGITSFYMFRLYYGIFWYKPANEFGIHEASTGPDADHAAKEAPPSMLAPLVLLAIGTVLFGLVPFSNFVTLSGAPLDAHLHISHAAIAVFVSLTGIILATVMFRKESGLPDKIVSNMKGIHALVSNKFYFDEVYLFVTKKIIFNLISKPANWFDKHIVDGFVNGTATTTTLVSERIKVMQSGRLQDYVFYFLGGVLVLGMIFIHLL